MIGSGREAQRQQALVAALFAPVRADAAALLPACQAAGDAQIRAAGLGAYRGNARAVAARALAAAFPVTWQLLGDAADDAAVHLWRSTPPTSGDLAQWGAAFPDWLAAQSSLREFPQLVACARLEWAVHQSEAAADALTDIDSLALLETVDAQQLVIELRPAVRLVAGVPGFVEVWQQRDLRADGQHAHAVVARPALIAEVTAVGARWHTWLAAAARGSSLAALTADLPPLLEAIDTEPETDLLSVLSIIISKGWFSRLVRIEESR